MLDRVIGLRRRRARDEASRGAPDAADPIKALEQRVGQVLVVREKPCKPTAAGIPLVRLAAQTAMLESEVLAETGSGSVERTRIAIAVNADSMFDMVHCRAR